MLPRELLVRSGRAQSHHCNSVLLKRGNDKPKVDPNNISAVLENHLFAKEKDKEKADKDKAEGKDDGGKKKQGKGKGKDKADSTTNEDS